MAAVYRFLAYDLRTNVALGELPLAGVNYGGVLNRPGKLKGSLTLQPQTARDLRTNSTPERVIVYVERDGVIIDGYIIWGRKTLNTPPLTIDADSVFSYIDRNRIVTAMAPFAAVDQFTIAQTLVNAMQSQAGANVGIIVGSETCGVVRDRTYYAYERKNIGEALAQLAAVNNGFDVAINIGRDGSGVPTKTLKLSYPKQGRDASATGIVFELGKNVEAYEFVEDGTRSTRSVDAFGKGDGADMLISTQTRTDLIDAGYPLTSGSIAYKDVSVQATLDAHARAAVDAGAATPLFITITVNADDIDGGIGHWIVGDAGRFTIPDDLNFPAQSDGSPGFTGLFRILAYNVAVSDLAGKEQLAITLGQVSA